MKPLRLAGLEGTEGTMVLTQSDRAVTAPLRERRGEEGRGAAETETPNICSSENRGELRHSPHMEEESRYKTLTLWGGKYKL